MRALGHYPFITGMSMKQTTFIILSSSLGDIMDLAQRHEEGAGLTIQWSVTFLVSPPPPHYIQMPGTHYL
jgi:hypothetical protein